MSGLARGVLIVLLVIPPVALGGERPWAQLPIMVLVLLGTVATVGRQAPEDSAQRLGPLAVILALWCVACAARSIHPLTSAWECAWWLTLLAVWRLARLGTGRPSALASAMTAASLTMGLISAYGLWETLVGADRILGMPKLGYFGHVTGTFFNHTHFAAHLLGVLPFTIVLAFRSPYRWLRPLLLVAALAQLLALAFSRSRGGWLGAAVMAAVGLVHTVVHGRGRAAVGPVVIVGLAVSLVLGTGLSRRLPELRDRLATLTPTSASELGLFGRLVLWKGTLTLARAAPVMGHGPATYYLSFLQVRPPGYFFGLSHAHNEYLQMAAETGLVGLVLALVFVAAHLRRLAVRPDGTLLVALLGPLAVAVGDWPLRVPATALLVATLMGAAAADQEETAKPENDGEPGPHSTLKARALGAALLLIAGLPLGTRLRAEFDRVRGQRLAEAGDLEGAVAAYGLALDRWGVLWPTALERSHRCIDLARSADVAGLHQQALHFAQAALTSGQTAARICPLHPDTWRAVARAHQMHVGLYGPRNRRKASAHALKALSALLEASRRDPRHHLPAIELGNFQYRLGRLAEAKVTLTRALEVYPTTRIGEFPEIVRSMAPLRDVLTDRPVDSITPEVLALAESLLTIRARLAPADFRPGRLREELAHRFGDRWTQAESVEPGLSTTAPDPASTP